MPIIDFKNHLTPKEFAYEVNKSHKTIYGWIESGKIEAVKVDFSVYIPKTELDRFAKRIGPA